MPTTKKYLCGIDYSHEMEMGTANFYDSVKELKDNGICWEECGIVEIELDESGEEVGHKWVLEQKLFGNTKKDPKDKKEFDQ